MIINNEMNKEMYNELLETKEISSLSFNEKDLRDWSHTLNSVSGLSYKRRQLGDDELDEFKVPAALRDLVVPRKISRELGEDFRDFKGASYTKYSENLDKHGMQGAQLLDAVKFNRISKGIVGSRKASNASMVSITEESKEVTIDSISDRLVNLTNSSNKVHSSTTHYYPVDYNQDNFMEDEFYTQEAVNMARKWFADALNNIKRA